MARSITHEWESQKSKNLAEVLAQDNGEFLYVELPRIAGYRCKVYQREDFIQDFFIDITGKAHSYKYGIDVSKSIHEDLNLKAWLIKSYYNFRNRFYEKEKWRILKENGKPRAREFSLGRIIRGNMRLVNPNCYQLRDDWYRICMQGTEYPCQGMIEIEEEIERKKQALAEVIQKAMNQLNQNRRELIQLYYFEGLDTRTIGRALGISQSNVTSQLLFARKDLMKILPYSVVDKRGWVETREAA